MSESNQTDIISTNNKRIAKNTMMLYFRMIFILFVGLLTTRVVLNTLGIEDYGLYNVVGGFVLMFAFFNGAMSTATQRFITFELARGDIQRQRIAFSTALIIHFALAAIIFILAETVGLWMVYNKLVIPETRFTAALWVYQLSIATCILNIVSIPYNSVIIAHEKMSAFAYISILDVSLKLIIVFALTISSWDNLILYSLLLFAVQIINRFIYGLYCSRHFAEARFVRVFNKRLFYEMNNIAGWSIFGNIAGVGYTQGLNLLLNVFFGPNVNAARGIAVTVQGVVSGFVSNFQMALSPQITKSYAISNLERMHKLIFASSKYSFFLLLILILPIIIEAKPILMLWLKLVPEHSVWFLRLTLFIMLIEALANPLMVSSQAIGKVKIYQSVVGGTLLLIVPIAYLGLKLGCDPESVFVTHFFVAIVAQFFRILIISKQIQMSLMVYFKNVIQPIMLVSLFSVVPSVCIYLILPPTLGNAFIVIVFSVMITLFIVVLMGLTKSERGMVVSKAISLLKVKNKYAK